MAAEPTNNANKPAGEGQGEGKPEGKPAGQKPQGQVNQKPETITMSRADLDALLARHKQQVVEEVKAEITSGGKVRQVDERETSRGETLANMALARAALNEPEDGKIPEGCVRFMPLKAFHVSRADIPEYGDVEGASVEIVPDADKPPIVLKKKTAEMLQARKFGRIV